MSTYLVFPSEKSGGVRAWEQSFCKRLSGGCGARAWAVELTVSPNNAAALKLYQGKLGFKTIGFRKDEYGPSEDRLLLRLDLV